VPGCLGFLAFLGVARGVGRVGFLGGDHGKALPQKGLLSLKWCSAMMFSNSRVVAVIVFD